MSKQSDRKQVIRDERDAEVLYQAHLEEARKQALAIASDDRRMDAERAAAKEAELALSRIEEARKKASATPNITAARQTFWKWLTGN